MENKINLTPNDPIKIKTGGIESVKPDLAAEAKTAIDLKSILSSDPLTEKKINEEKGVAKGSKNEKPVFFSAFAKDTAKAGVGGLPPYSPAILGESKNIDNGKPWKQNANMDSSSSKFQPAIETKQPSPKVTLVIVGAVAALVTAFLSGGLVYFWQSSETETAKQNTAKLQTEVNNLKSQVGTLAQALENEKAANALKETSAITVPTVTITPKMSTEGWTKYVFNEVNDLHAKPFEFSYPAYGVIKGSAEAQSMGLKVPVSKLLTFAANGKDCWLNILDLTSGSGTEQATTGLTTDTNEIAIGETRWINSISKLDGKISHYVFSGEDAYNFSVSPENLDQCLETYQTILSTFRFTNEAG